MKLLVGLGNPGRRYARSRHNAGFLIAERFAADHRLPGFREDFEGLYAEGEIAPPAADAPAVRVGVLLPQTFMNLSGDAVVAAVASLGVGDVGRDLLVAYDDVDLPFGRLRIRHAGGAGGHNGLAHVALRLGHPEFPRLRFGVGRPTHGSDTRDHVLEGFSRDESEELPRRIARAADAAALAFTAGVEAAMNRYNRADDEEPAQAPGPERPGSSR